MNKQDQNVWKDLEQLKNEPFSEEKEGPSPYRKTLIFFIGTFIFLLMTSFVFVTYPIGDILSGRMVSEPLKGGTLNLDQLTIVFEKETAGILRAFYNQEQKVEWSACLQGKVEMGVKPLYHITSLYQPKMHEQAFNHVSFEPCSRETLIALHSHPYKSCLASETDLQTLQKTKQENPETLMVVMCEPERFTVYS